MNENKNSSESPTTSLGLLRLVSIAMISVVMGFVSTIVALGIGGIGVLKPIPYIFPIAILVGSTTALVGFSLWPRPSRRMTHKNQRLP